MERNGAGFWLVFIITAFIMLFNLGGIPLLDPDEPVYAETPKEMLEFYDFLSPRIYGQYWYDKPPMYYWLVAGSFKIFGMNEFAARFPSALLALVGVLVVYRFAAKSFNPRAGLASALVLASSIEYFYLGKAAVTDITLNLFLTLCLFSFIEKRYYLFYLFSGLAVVTKGPVGLLFPAAIVFIYLVVTGNIHELTKMKLPVGILIFSVVAVPWYWFMYKIHGRLFIDTFLGFHNITRFTSPEHPEGVLWWYFIPVLIIGFFPWTAIMIQSIWASLTESRQDLPVMVFLNIWAAFIFIFFTISRTKLVSYILPMYPPLALIAGWYLDKIWDGRYLSGGRKLSWPIILLTLVILLIIGMFLGLNAMPALNIGVIATACIFTFMAMASLYFIWRREIAHAFWTQVIAMALFVVVLMTMLLPLAAPYLASKYIAEEFTGKYDGQSPVYIVKFLRPGFAFYTGMYGREVKVTVDSVEELERAIRTSGRAYFLVREMDYRKLKESERSQLITLTKSADKILLLKK